MLLRRRIMMETTPAKDWDVAWDYMMGVPDENGFEKTVDRSPLIEMTENGLNISITDGGYVRYIPIGYETCNEGIFEETITYYAFSSSNGNRMILSDGTSGLQIYVVNTQIRFNNDANNSQIIIANDIELQKEYIIRIERLNGINRIFLDGEEVYETEVVSGSFTTGNRIFFQTDGDYLLKSIKFKKIS